MRIRVQTTDLEEIILKYKPLISYRVRKSLGSSNPDWEDIVSEIILNVIENIKLGKFNGESSLGTYIYIITTRRIIDYIRKKKKDIKYETKSDSFSDPCRRLEEKERTEFIARCLKKLKPLYCDILYSYYYSDLSQKEIARIFGLSPSRVSQIISRGQMLLKIMMEG